MAVYEVKGEMRWEGVFTVEAPTPEAAKQKILEGEWTDWTPTNLCDWEAVAEPQEQKLPRYRDEEVG